jgi:hypothetical protein
MIGIIVDGPGDFATLHARFHPGFQIRKTDGPRGHTVPPERIVATAGKQIRMLSVAGCTSIILLVDFEARTEQIENFLQALTAEINRRKYPVPVFACAANRMIENWFLADIAHLSIRKNFIRTGLKQKNYEGTDGKRELRALFIRGVTYNEVRHGPQMFQSIRFNVARENSPSFDHFLSSINV